MFGSGTFGAEPFGTSGAASAAASISAAIGWTEGSETFAASGTVSAPAITAAIGWVDGSEVFALAGVATGSGVSAGDSSIYVAPAREVIFEARRATVVFEGQTTLVRF